LLIRERQHERQSDNAANGTQPFAAELNVGSPYRSTVSGDPPAATARKRGGSDFNDVGNAVHTREKFKAPNATVGAGPIEPLLCSMPREVASTLALDAGDQKDASQRRAIAGYDVLAAIMETNASTSR
jgi:hypothetical protein